MKQLGFFAKANRLALLDVGDEERPRGWATGSPPSASPATSNSAVS